MANQNGNENAFIKQLKDDHQQRDMFELFALMRAIESRALLSQPLGHSKTPRDDVARFGQSPLSAFHAAAISNISLSTKIGKYKIKNSYWGLFGHNGALPSHLTEYAQERISKHKDDTLCEFLDIFHHRLICLYYRAWKTGYPAIQFDHMQTNQFVQQLSALARSESGALSTDIHPQATSDSSPAHQRGLYFAGLLTHKNLGAKAVQQILSDLFSVAVIVNEFQASWLTIARRDRSVLTKSGTANNKLKHNAIIGKRTFQRSYKVTVELAALKLEQYTQFLPNHAQGKALKRWINQLISPDITVDVTLNLASGECCSSRLSQQTRLGYTSWLQPQSQKNNSSAFNKTYAVMRH
ncbi:type VI secretion system baseplate subunit TssG [Thalassotalea euphylliae]|uniref:Type VI secretion system baseplate subunit TssG n=1 Tax=Thalassotalea euphylliae TaxID=1655234 RepID=A0A3E0TSR7_9GAMM|nr:type VI secretion system baseplate subunit TssG [Thalassotalea euphylliae]REL27686.1 type VI secretion system baseplate subunit TssG [Thalassotalea euphylliae]